MNWQEIINSQVAHQYTVKIANREFNHTENLIGVALNQTSDSIEVETGRDLVVKLNKANLTQVVRVGVNWDKLVITNKFILISVDRLAPNLEPATLYGKVEAYAPGQKKILFKTCGEKETFIDTNKIKSIISA